jgi:FAD/FMN-containing dehydrogenase
VPVEPPTVLLNRWSVTAFNALYYSRAKEGEALIDYRRYFYPLDNLRAWNRLYGKRGFLQYQCVLPRAASPAGMTALLQRISRSGLGSFLAVLKAMGPAAPLGMLSFPQEGFTLALDFPAHRRSFALLAELDAITRDHGGRIYLAKDSRGLPDLLNNYPRLADFRAQKRAIDPQGKFSSLLSQRLGL